MAIEGIGKASIEALDHSVGLWVVGLGELVPDVVAGAQAIEGMASGACVATGVLSSAEAIGELCAVISEHCVDRVAEGLKEASEGIRDGVALAVVEDIDMNEAGHALDYDEDIGAATIETITVERTAGLSNELRAQGRARPIRS
jgi:hypothetical protein